jgi:hypothetical protein
MVVDSPAKRWGKSILSLYKFIFIKKIRVSMKTKITLLITVCAVVTLSFTFVATRTDEPKQEPIGKTSENEPIGGFVSEASE